MDEFKWAWVLFVAASVAVLVRVALWFLPGPAIRHADRVARAAEQEEAGVAAEPETAETAASELPDAAEPEAVLEDLAWPDDVPETEESWPPLDPGVWDDAAPDDGREPASPPEDYHFRRTRWGMTPAEVREAEGIPALRETPESLVYVTTTLELPCRLTYGFARDALTRAHLAFSDPDGRDIPPLSMAQAQRRFLFLREQLRRRYGEPVEHSVQVPRDVSALRRRLQKQDELTEQYDAEIAEAEARLRSQRERLQTRYARWQRRDELIARGLAPYERDLRDLKEWKQEALETAAQARRLIQENQAADARTPLVAVLSARWPFAREIQDIEMRLDQRRRVPRLEIRYRAARPGMDLPGGMDEL